MLFQYDPCWALSAYTQSMAALYGVLMMVTIFALTRVSKFAPFLGKIRWLIIGLSVTLVIEALLLYFATLGYPSDICSIFGLICFIVNLGIVGWYSYTLIKQTHEMLWGEQ